MEYIGEFPTFRDFIISRDERFVASNIHPVLQAYFDWDAYALDQLDGFRLVPTDNNTVLIYEED